MSSISLFLDRLLTLVRLAFRSAGNRRTNFWLTLLSIALSTSLLLAVQRGQQAIHDSFTRAVFRYGSDRWCANQSAAADAVCGVPAG